MTFNGSGVRRRPNPVTRAAFRRQVRLEVYLPLALALLLVLVLVAVAVSVPLGSASSWADAFLVLLAVPLALLLLLMLMALGAAGYAVFRVIRELPPYTAGIQEGAENVSRAVRRASDSAARVAIVPGGILEAVREAGRALRSVFRRTG
jgi:hypothetical protein